MAVSLPDDVLLEILVRVEEAATLFRCAMACKQWLSLFTDPSFRRQLWPDDQHAFSFIGFIAKDKRHGRPRGVNGLVLPAPRSGLGPRCRAVGPFMSAAYADLLEGAVPLASRRGLLLVRLGSALGDSDRNVVVQMAVCNLIANTCDVLPPLKLYIDDCESCGYAVLTDVDCLPSSDRQQQVLPSNSALFKVVIIGFDEVYGWYNLYTFLSCEVSWRTRIGCLSSCESTRTRQPFSDVTVCMAHWARWGVYLVTLNIQTGQLTCTELHEPLNYHHTGRSCLTLAMDEKIALLWMRSSADPKLDILAQQQNVGSDAEWSCTSTIEQEQQRGDNTRLHILGNKCWIIFVKDSRHQHVYTVELKTGTMEEVVGWPGRCGITPWESVPLEMDWPSFFISRLAISHQNVYTVDLETGTTEKVMDLPRRCGIIPLDSVPLEMDWLSFFISRLAIRDSTREVAEKAGGRAYHGNPSEQVV